MDHAATFMAIDLLQLPARVRLIRAAPLPSGVETLLQIAAGNDAMTSLAVEATGRPHATVKEAAAFFIEQVLLHPESDSYRVLGAQPEASTSEIRRNMALLLRWLHPDHNRRSDRTVFAHRVTRAWDDLKTDERRAAYDRQRRLALFKKSNSQTRPRSAKKPASQPGRSRSMPHFTTARRPLGTYPQRSSLMRKILLLLLGRPVY